MNTRWKANYRLENAGMKTVYANRWFRRGFPVALLAIAAVLAMAGTSRAMNDELYEQNLLLFKQSSVVNEFFRNSYGYAFFPLAGKGGAGLGAGFGKGRVYRQGELTGRATLAKLSLGPQLGGQAYSEIIFFENEPAYNAFTGGTFELDATVSAVAIVAGAHAEAGTGGVNAGATAGPATGIQAPVRYVKGMAVFTHTRGGLMLEASLGAQKFFYKPLR